MCTYLQDSIVAMEALTEYAYRARLRDITDMNIMVEASASPGASQNIHIHSNSLATVHQFQVPFSTISGLIGHFCDHTHKPDQLSRV